MEVATKEDPTAFVRVATQLVTYRTARSSQNASRRLRPEGSPISATANTARYTELAPTRFESLFGD